MLTKFVQAISTSKEEQSGLGQTSMSAIKRAFVNDPGILRHIRKHLALRKYQRNTEMSRHVAGLFFDMLSSESAFHRFHGDMALRSYMGPMATSLALVNGDFSDTDDEGLHFSVVDDMVTGIVSTSKNRFNQTRMSMPETSVMSKETKSKLYDLSKTEPKLQFGRTIRTFIDAGDITPEGMFAALDTADRRNLKKLSQGLSTLARVLSRPGALSRFLRSGAMDLPKQKGPLSKKSIERCIHHCVQKQLRALRLEPDDPRTMPSLLRRLDQSGGLAQDLVETISKKTYIFLTFPQLHNTVKTMMLAITGKQGLPVTRRSFDSVTSKSCPVSDKVVAMAFENLGQTTAWETDALEKRYPDRKFSSAIETVIDKKRRNEWKIGYSLMLDKAAELLDEKVRHLIARGVPKKRIRALVGKILDRNKMITMEPFLGETVPVLETQWLHDSLYGLTSISFPPGIPKQLSSNIVSIIESEAQGDTNIWGAMAKVCGLVSNPDNLAGISKATSFNDLSCQIFENKNSRLMKIAKERIGEETERFFKSAAAIGQTDEVGKLLPQIPDNVRLVGSLEKCVKIDNSLRLGILPRNNLYGILGSGVPGVCISTSSKFRLAHISKKGMKNLVVFSENDDHVRIRLWGLLVPAYKAGTRCLVLNNLQGHVHMRNRDKVRQAILEALGSYPCAIYVKSQRFNAISLTDHLQMKKHDDLILKWKDRLDLRYDANTKVVLSETALVPGFPGLTGNPDSDKKR